MKTDIQQFEEVLTKFKFTTPVPHDIRERSGAMVKPALQATLKKLNRYSFLSSLVLGVFFFSRRFGPGLTITQSSVAVALSAVMAAGAVTTGGYYTVKVLKDKPASVEAPSPDGTKSIKTDTKNNTLPRRAVVSPYKKIIVLEPLRGSLPSPEIDRFNAALQRELTELRGAARISTSPGNNAVTLRGQLGEGSGSFHLFLRLIAPSGEIIHAEAFSASTVDGLFRAIPTIARKINAKVK